MKSSHGRNPLFAMPANGPAPPDGLLPEWFLSAVSPSASVNLPSATPSRFQSLWLPSVQCPLGSCWRKACSPSRRFPSLFRLAQALSDWASSCWHVHYQAIALPQHQNREHRRLPACCCITGALGRSQDAAEPHEGSSAQQQRRQRQRQQQQQKQGHHLIHFLWCEKKKKEVVAKCQRERNLRKLHYAPARFTAHPNAPRRFSSPPCNLRLPSPGNQACSIMRPQPLRGFRSIHTSGYDETRNQGPELARIFHECVRSAPFLRLGIGWNWSM